MKKQYIYTLTDPISKEIRYVGKSNNPEERLKRHLSVYNLSESWTSKNKWLLYLKNNNLLPIMNIIDEGYDSNINDLEIKWISHYENLGYKLTNMTKGGDGFDWTGRKHKIESIEKMKMNHPLRKEIIQFDLDNNIIGIYNSSYEAEEKSGILRSSIIRSCKGKYIQVKGYYFRFIDSYFPCKRSKKEPNLVEIKREVEKFNSNKVEYLTNNQITRQKISKRNSKSIIHYDLSGNLLNLFQSMSEARDKTGCHIGLISKCCNLKSYYTVKGTTFRYENDKFDYVPYNKNVQINSKKICKYNLNGKLENIYDSIKEARRANGVSSDSNITSCCERKINKKTGSFIVVKGYTYRYFSETNGQDLD